MNLVTIWFFMASFMARQQEVRFNPASTRNE